MVSRSSQGSSTCDLLVHEQRYLEDIFAKWRVIATHAEDEERSVQNSLILPQENIADMLSAETLSARLSRQRELYTCYDHNHRLHIVHLTSGAKADWLSLNKGDPIPKRVLNILLSTKMMLKIWEFGPQ